VSSSAPERGAVWACGVSHDCATRAAIARVFRDEAGRLTGALVRLIGDFDEAEDLVQEALLEALEHWPREGIPDRPGAWLMTAARRKGIDRWRRQARYQEALSRIVSEPGDAPGEPDDRLRLMFMCCHPALGREAQLALTLRAVVGLTTGEIARAFLSSEATIAQRIVRAKRKIVEARIAYRVPAAGDLTPRLDEILRVLYLLFNEGYLSTGHIAVVRRDLAEDAEWLTALLDRLLPGQPETLGLLALIRLHRARDRARLGPEGRLVLLQHQDRRLWDRAAIVDAAALLERAARMGRPGPYQVQAAIVACHAESPSWEATDWPQILALYDVLARFDPSPVVALNRAIAFRHVAGPEAALVGVDTLGGVLGRYHLFHATRAELLRALGRNEEARDADLRAIALTANPAERALLEERIAAM
jgi:RNA polymerase sigma factor (sigma-70 family)